ncbi:uncharacterized protein LOC122504190 [Leptopilina heterotoma]|uniref:uncharacterized protein LOC122504190 n=1 Tax=Leptopilina heterotoma TaxID=63436 RepID=UPI001CA8A017|nr:uncharacterized protein LOC122504190 [Leptopilina heterotoma]
MFAQIFRLLSTYSLIKPKRGSNVEGCEILNALLTCKDIDDNRFSNICSTLERIISDDDPSIESIPNFLDKVRDHDERLSRTEEFVQGFVAGYVAFRAQRLTKCDECLSTTITDNHERDDAKFKMINLCNKGRLKYPSEILYNLTETLENVILSIVAGGQLNCDTFFHITQELEKYKLPLIGCENHTVEFTKSIVSFYLITRAHFIAKRYNVINNSTKEKSKKCHKDAKL